VETNEKEMIKTAAQYVEWSKNLKAELVKIGNKVPTKERFNFHWRLASNLDVSQMTIKNYFNGFGTDPHTALKIKEEAQRLIKEMGF